MILSTDAMTDEDRITKLEELYCHQSDLLEQLDRTVYEQQRTIEQLMVRLVAVERQLSQTADPAGAAPAHDKPPHY